MESEKPVAFRSPLAWGEQDPRRRRATPIGMWAWLLQRLSAVAIIIFLGLHLWLTYKPAVQLLLLIAVVFHATLGIRVILLDLDWAPVRRQKTFLAILGILAIAAVVIVWNLVY